MSKVPKSLISNLQSPSVWAKVVFVIILGLLAAPQLWYPFGFDQGVYAACGDVIRRGGIPIQDCFETKQPGVMVMYAIPMLFSLSPVAVHAFTLLWTALTSLLIAGVARWLLHPSAAWPAAAFYWLAYAGINYWSMDQAETFANLFLVVAVYAAWRAGERRGWRWLVIGGAAIGICFWFKYVFGLFGIALALVLVLHTWRSRSRALIGSALLNGAVFGMTALSVVGLGLACYALTNALPALASQFQFLQAAFPLGPPRTPPEILAQLMRFADNGADITAAFKATTPQWIVLGGGFPLLFVLAFIGAWRSLKRGAMAYLYLLAIFVAGAAVVVWQANYIQYHYTSMIPPLALAAGGASQGLNWQPAPAGDRPGALARFAGVGVAIIMAAAVILLAVRMLPWVNDTWQNVVLLGKSPRDIYLESAVAPNVPVAEYISAHTAPGDTIAIFGDAPWVYTLANRRNATRFSFINLWLRKREAVTYPLFTQQYLDGLIRNQPVYFILAKPNFPWPNNDYIPDYKAAGAIYEFVESHYAYEGENGPFLLYHRK